MHPLPGPRPPRAARSSVVLALVALPLWWLPFDRAWMRLFGPAPTATPTATATPRPSPTPTPTPDVLSAGVVAPPAPYFSFRRPFDPPLVVEGSRYFPFGTDAGGTLLVHHGIDIGNPLGAEVRAVGDGRVVFAGEDDVVQWGPTKDFYGRLVVVEMAERLGAAPLYSLYGHLDAVNVRTGAVVARGEVVGLVGAAGVALGPHLHLEFRVRGRDYDAVVNPELLLAPLAERGTIVGRVRGADGHAVAGADVTLFALDAAGDATFAGQTTTYPAAGFTPAWRWDENFLFADVPAGRYAVVWAAGEARAEAALAPGGAVLVALRALD